MLPVVSNEDQPASPIGPIGQFSVRQLILRLASGNITGYCQRLASELHTRVGLTSPPFNPRTMAERLGIPVEYADIAARAQLREGSGRPVIVVHRSPSVAGNTGLSPTGRARELFAIAHELGHWVIREEIRVVLPGYLFPADDLAEERWADQFATELLMPMRTIGPQIRACAAAIDGLLNLAALYQVSVEAALLRATESYSRALVPTIWNFRGPRCELHWSGSKRMSQSILCDTGSTPVEVAYASKSERQSFGSVDILVDGRRQRWPSVSLRLPGSTLVACLLSKDREIVGTWKRKAKQRDMKCEAVQQSFPFAVRLVKAPLEDSRRPNVGTAGLNDVLSHRHAKHRL